MLDYTGEKYDTLPPGLPANLNKIKFVKNLLANTRSVLGGGRSVAVLCALSGNTIACSCSTRAAVLLGKQQQQLSSPSVGTRPQQKCQVLSAKLETKKDGYDTDTDVRESHEIQEKVQKEQRTPLGTPSPAKRADSQQGVAWSNE